MVAKRKTIKPVQGHDTHPLRLFMPLGFYLHHTEVYRDENSLSRRSLLRRAFSRHWQRAGRHPSRPYFTEQHRQSSQPHYDHCAHHLGAEEKLSAHTHIVIDYDFLESVSVVLLEQIRTIDKERLSDCLGRISVQDMQRVEAAMAVSLGMRWRHDR